MPRWWYVTVRSPPSRRVGESNIRDLLLLERRRGKSHVDRPSLSKGGVIQEEQHACSMTRRHGASLYSIATAFFETLFAWCISRPAFPHCFYTFDRSCILTSHPVVLLLPTASYTVHQSQVSTHQSLRRYSHRIIVGWWMTSSMVVMSSLQWVEFLSFGSKYL